jgi:hypothetical protein
MKTTKISIVLLLFLIISCQKKETENTTISPITPGETTLHVINSKQLYNSTTGKGVKFDMNYVSFNYLGDLFTQFKYEVYTGGNAFTVIWDGEIHQRNDSSYYYFAIHNEVAGTPSGIIRADSTLLSSNILSLGITQEQLKAPKTGVKITNTSNVEFTCTFPLNNGCGSWGEVITGL